ncbi:MAG: glycosyltransferase [Bacteroidales bacterium]
MKSSVVICAYNEDKTIRDVLVSMSDCKIFDEIIVVNDGSADNTKKS